MKACGVIVEYNPFHLGHQYHLKTARKKSGCDCLIAVMSGNWLQRGEPAIFDKWQRAESALKNGCDLVIELPPHVAIQSADFFSRGAVALLNDLKITTLAFGTDVKEEMDYQKLGQLLVKKDAEVKSELFSLRHSGLNFPNQMKQVYDNLGIHGAFSQETPNHILAISYAKEVARQNKQIQLLPIKRKGQGFKETGETTSFASATHIRKQIFLESKLEIKEQVPQKTWETIEKMPPVSWEDYFSYYSYLLKSQKKEELKKIYQVEEGLENHLVKGDFSNFFEYLESIKTKRYSYTRLQRVMSYLLLNMTKEEVTSQQNYLRILGFNEVGRRYLNEIKGKTSYPLITRQTKENQELLALNNRVDAIYQLKQEVPEQIKGRIPLNI